MGAKRKGDTRPRLVPLPLQVLPETRAALERIAERRGGNSVGSVAREAIEDFLVRQNFGAADELQRVAV